MSISHEPSIDESFFLITLNVLIHKWSCGYERIHACRNMPHERMVPMTPKNMHTIFVLITSIPISIVNFSAYLKGGDPSSEQVLLSVIYVILWGVYGFILGRKGIGFIRFLTYYWGIGMLIYILGYLLQLEWLQLLPMLAVFIFAGPLYGLRHFYELQSWPAMVIINTLVLYSFSILGHWVGKGIREISQKR